MLGINSSNKISTSLIVYLLRSVVNRYIYSPITYYLEKKKVSTFVDSNVNQWFSLPKHKWVNLSKLYSPAAPTHFS